MDETNDDLLGGAAIEAYGRWLGQVLALQTSWFATLWALQAGCASGPWGPLAPWLIWQRGTEQLA